MLAAAALTTAHADTLSLDASSGGWKAIAPPGAATNNSYPSPSPINDVGLVWESTNTGWNSSASYNDASWGSFAGGWVDGTGITPFYARKVFNISGAPTSGTFSLQVDDDSQAWVNGTLVLDDQNMATFNPYSNTVDITSYLHTGNNVIAFKAHNSAGGGFEVGTLSGTVNFTAAAPVPEPGTMALTFAGLGLIGGLRRRRAKRA
jgi:hypothetical protein